MVQRTLLALGAPVILFTGGLWAFVRTYQLWRKRGTWWAWRGARLVAAHPDVAGPHDGTARHRRTGHRRLTGWQANPNRCPPWRWYARSNLARRRPVAPGRRPPRP